MRSPILLRMPKSTMQIDEYRDQFFIMEMEERLFSMRDPRSDPVWDIVRFDVFISLFDKTCEPDDAARASANEVPRSSATFSRIWTFPTRLRTLATQCFRLQGIRRVDFLAFICSRYNDANGGKTDFASKDAVNALSKLGSITRIESEIGVFRDINFPLLRNILRRVIAGSTANKRFVKEFTRAIAHAQRTYFGISDPRLFEVLWLGYTNYLAERYLWRLILDRSKPQFVLMVQNGIQKALLVEAHKRSIPVVECQHGVINTAHAAYSYPAEMTLVDSVMTPDALLLFSNYWKKQCRIPRTELLAVGNDSFATRNSRSSRTGPAIFVDAGIFHHYLSPLAIEVARLAPDRHFIMKLHPSQSQQRHAIEAEYKDISNLSVIGMEKTLPALLADCSDIVVIQSTASYEALERGVPVHILRRAGYRSHADLFSNPNVFTFSDSKELVHRLFKARTEAANDELFFERFDEGYFRSIVASLCRQEAVSAV